MKLLKGIVLGSILLSASHVSTSHAHAGEDTSAEINSLKAKLKELEQRVGTQGRKEAETRAKLAAIKPVPYTKVPAAFAACPDDKFCYRGITLTPGGWIDLTDIYRTRSLASDSGSVFAAIPFANNRGHNVQENRFTARQSRFSLLAEGNVDAQTRLAGYGEIDFESAGSTSNPVATNSFTPRMRQASLEIDRKDLGLHVLAGQTWSLNSPSKKGIDPRGIDAPGVIDFESVPGLFAARQPGIRIWKDFGPEFAIAISAENAQTSFFGGSGDFTGATPFVGTPVSGPKGVVNTNLLFSQNGPGGSFFNPLTNVSLNRIPDVTVKAAWDPMIGSNKLHIEAWGMYREFFDRFDFANHTVSGLAYGTHVNLEIVPKVLDLQFSASNGAQGRFSQTPLPDATFRQDGSIQVLPIFGLQGGLVWHTTPMLDIYSYAGLEKTKATFSFGSDGVTPFGYGNPLYDNTGCNTEGSTKCNGNTSEVRQFTAGFFHTLHQGPYGAVKVGTQYSYTQRFAFAGVGGAPRADDHIVMTQLRYLPF